MEDHIGEGENQYVLSVVMTMNTLHTKHTHKLELCSISFIMSDKTEFIVRS